jgi:hypothetical protein
LDDEGPANLDFAAFGFVAIIAAGPNQSGGRPIDEHKGHFGGDRAVEVLSECRFGVAIGNGMDLPDLRIGAGGEQL